MVVCVVALLARKSISVNIKLHEFFEWINTSKYFFTHIFLPAFLTRMQNEAMVWMD